MKPTKEKLLYFDCEWVPIANTYFDLKMDHPNLAEVFEHQVEKWKHNNIRDGKPIYEDLDAWWEEKAHFHPEFCKMICVSYGYYKKKKSKFDAFEFEIQSVYGDDEKKLLTTVQQVFDKVNTAGMYLSGYMIKRFDMPWLAKRMMINGIKPPPNISVYDKKPWEVDVFDLPEVWGQGNMQESYTPFELACTAMGIESSKDDLSGKEVKEAYYKGEMERIKIYCEKDVLKSQELASALIELLP
jgi:3'-5' exonuclease